MLDDQSYAGVGGGLMMKSNREAEVKVEPLHVFLVYCNAAASALAYARAMALLLKPHTRYSDLPVVAIDDFLKSFCLRRQNKDLIKKMFGEHSVQLMKSRAWRYIKDALLYKVPKLRTDVDMLLAGQLFEEIHASIQAKIFTLGLSDGMKKVPMVFIAMPLLCSGAPFVEQLSHAFPGAKIHSMARESHRSTDVCRIAIKYKQNAGAVYRVTEPQPAMCDVLLPSDVFESGTEGVAGTAALARVMKGFDFA